MSKKPILYDIRIATGIAIILVVIGHLASRGEIGIDAYVNLKRVIYKFHMPLFLCLSGYIAYYTYQPIESFKDYTKFVKKKFIRLFPAYIILSSVFLIGKYFFVEDTDVNKSIVSVLIYPSEGSSGFLWYLYVLFLYNLCMPIIDYMVRNKFLLFFVTSLALSSFVNFPKMFSLNIFVWYLPFFILGCYLVTKRETSLSVLQNFGLVIIILFSVWGILEYLNLVNIPKSIISLFAIFSVGYISSIKIVRSSVLEKIGYNSFYIYLFNTMFMGALSVLLIKWLGKDAFYHKFYYFAPVLVIIGVLFPILLHKYVISRIPILKNLIK
ncbi:acyltransferase [Winogradskyella sp.]|uniref:acyltransferase family protein n=1 Tax=Winogradskyella sp. TaxID=1883156 RepID=UPI0025D97BA0|nr:acyltransferase [Winogradskyella sp.]